MSKSRGSSNTQKYPKAEFHIEWKGVDEEKLDLLLQKESKNSKVEVLEYIVTPFSVTLF